MVKTDDRQTLTDLQRGNKLHKAFKEKMTTMALFVDIMRLQAAPPEEGKDACIRKPLYDSLAVGLPPVEAYVVDLFNVFLATSVRAVSR